jgi:hypothetical protein
MLTGDRAKYFSLVFTIAFCTFLLENQTTIFANRERRGSAVRRVAARARDRAKSFEASLGLDGDLRSSSAGEGWMRARKAQQYRNRLSPTT